MPVGKRKKGIRVAVVGGACAIFNPSNKQGRRQSWMASDRCGLSYLCCFGKDGRGLLHKLAWQKACAGHRVLCVAPEPKIIQTPDNEQHNTSSASALHLDTTTSDQSCRGRSLKHRPHQVSHSKTQTHQQGHRCVLQVESLCENVTEDFGTDVERQPLQRCVPATTKRR